MHTPTLYGPTLLGPLPRRILDTLVKALPPRRLQLRTLTTCFLHQTLAAILRSSDVDSAVVSQLLHAERKVKKQIFCFMLPISVQILTILGGFRR